MNETTRRNVLVGAAGASAAAVLGGCAEHSPGPGPDTRATSAPATDSPTVLTTTDDIPLNGGKVFVDRGVVITQPTPGEYKAFSCTCTHKGCAVSAVEGGTINCRCHGAKFAATDGSVQAGPATRPLDTRTIKVEKNIISLA